MSNLKGKTIFITGASRGIGLGIGLRAARDGANIVIAAKSDQPHSTLAGTIHSAAAQIEAAGGKALAVQTDIRDEDQIVAAVAAAVDRFGGIDILVNNASAMFRKGTLETETKRFDLLYDINVRGMFILTRSALPHLLKAANPHVLTIGPLLVNEPPSWYSGMAAYMISKYNMTMLAMAWAEEFRGKVAFNTLWPRLAIWTEANKVVRGAEAEPRARKPEIMADAAWHILTKDALQFTGRQCLDDDVLRDAGVTDFGPYYHPQADPSQMNKSTQISFGLYEAGGAHTK